VLPWWFAAVLAACSDGNSLEDFSRRALRAQVERGTGEEQPLFSASLQRVEAEEGCPRLRSSATATLNGTPLMVFPGQETEDSDLPCMGAPTVSLRVDVARFAGEPEDAVLELRDGDARMVAHFRNFYGRHALARGASPQVVKPGEEVFLAWDPPTDDLSSVTAVLFNDTFAPARPEAGGLRVIFPADLPAGLLTVRPGGFARVPVLRCEGVSLCSGAADTAPPAERETQVLIQP